MIKKITKFILIAALWIGIWAILALITGNEVLLPSPAATVKCLFYLAAGGDFWLSCLYSFIRIIIGILAGAAAGVFLAVLGAFFPVIGDIFSPVLSIIRATPVASFIILALVWIGKGNVPAFTAFLMILPVIWNSVTVAIVSIDKKLIEMTKVFRLSFTSRMKNLYIPSVLPSFTAGLRTSLGLAWKAGIAAEVICHPEYGIGTALYDSKVYINTPELFAWTAAVIIISMGLEAIFDRVIKKHPVRGGEKA